MGIDPSSHRIYLPTAEFEEATAEGQAWKLHDCAGQTNRIKINNSEQGGVGGIYRLALFR